MWGLHKKIIVVILMMSPGGLVWAQSASKVKVPPAIKNIKASPPATNTKTSPATENIKASPAEFAFQQLQDAENVNTQFDPEQYKNMDSVWVVFQKGCETCHKVLKESRCYAKKNKVAVIALGLYDDPSELLEDARKHGFKGPVVVSGEAVDEKFDLEVTPTTFVMHKNQLQQKFEAYVSCAKIKSALKKSVY